MFPKQNKETLTVDYVDTFCLTWSSSQLSNWFYIIYSFNWFFLGNLMVSLYIYTNGHMQFAINVIDDQIIFMLVQALCDDFLRQQSIDTVKQDIAL